MIAAEYLLAALRDGARPLMEPVNHKCRVCGAHRRRAGVDGYVAFDVPGLCPKHAKEDLTP